MQFRTSIRASHVHRKRKAVNTQTGAGEVVSADFFSECVNVGMYLVEIQCI